MQVVYGIRMKCILNENWNLYNTTLQGAFLQGVNLIIVITLLDYRCYHYSHWNNDVRMLYDIINHNTVCDFTENLVFLHNCNNTRGHSRRIRQQYSRINARKFSFVNRRPTVPIWNILPENIVRTNVSKCLSQRLKCINLNEFLSLDQ